MTNHMRLAKPLRRVAVIGVLLLAALSVTMSGSAQVVNGVQSPATQTLSAEDLADEYRNAPLVLQGRGSFMVGGESVLQTPTQLSFFTGQLPDAGGHVTINQMYVEYMVPRAQSGPPVVMIHGATLTGKSYDTTPDGRMGWYEYFVRRGHPVYVPDQVSRGRSGFDIADYNEVRAGAQPIGALPNYWRFTDELAWTQFRFGPSFGTPFPDTQFPVEAAGAFSAQAVPDLNAGLPRPDPNVAAMNALVQQVGAAATNNRIRQAGDVVLMGHSQTGMLPVSAMLADPTGIAGLIVLEPGGCGTARFTDQQIATLATVPILAVFGDHLGAVTGTAVSWQAAYDDCRAFVARVNAAGGSAQMLHPPDLGIRGNSHMIMQDKNNLQSADLILRWLDRSVRVGGAGRP